MNKILAIDDNELTFQHNLDNGIHIPAYEPQPTIESLSQDDDTLLRLKRWLSSPEVIQTADVTTLDKSIIFA